MTRNANRSRSILCLLAAAALGAASLAPALADAEPPSKAGKQAAPAPVDVSCKLQAGEMFRYSIRSRQVRQHQKPDETIIKWINRRAMVISCEVIEPDPEIGPRVVLTIDELNVTIMDPRKALRFTSENEHMNVVGAGMTLAMEPIVGAQLTLTLDKQGAIRKIEGADQLLREKELRKYAEHIVGDEAIDQLIQPIFRALAQPSAGDDPAPWSSSRVLEFPEFVTLDFEEQWDLRRRRAGRATFRVESAAEASINEAYPEAFLADSRTIGSFTWDEMTGRLHHAEINRFYVVDLENDPDGPSVAGEEVLTISAPLGEG